REFTITPQIPRKRPPGLAAQCRPGSRTLYNSLVILLHLMDTVAPRHQWRIRLRALIQEHAIPVTAMGFPPEWEGMAIWR
ncbi:MAG: Abi family protein, partial [Chromatiaceae bacterium]|nr:Abi family protein [Chromatiaceae bacterium]